MPPMVRPELLATGGNGRDSLGHHSLGHTLPHDPCLWPFSKNQEWGTAFQALPSSFGRLWAHSEEESDLSSLPLREEVRGGERCGILKVVQLSGLPGLSPWESSGDVRGSVHSIVVTHCCPRGSVLSAPA